MYTLFIRSTARILAIALVIVLGVTALGINAFADDKKKHENDGCTLDGVTVGLTNTAGGSLTNFSDNGVVSSDFPFEWDSIFIGSLACDITESNPDHASSVHPVNIEYSYYDGGYVSLSSSPITPPKTGPAPISDDAGSPLPPIDMSEEEELFLRFTLANRDGSESGTSISIKLVRGPETTSPGAPDPIKLNITSNFNAIIGSGSGSVSATIDADFIDFQRLLLGNTTVDPDDYEITSGSTIITLKEHHLNALAVGTHEYRAEFSINNMYAFADLILIKEAPKTNIEGPAESNSNSPKTGDSTPIWALGIIIIVGFSAVLILKKKVFETKH